MHDIYIINMTCKNQCWVYFYEPTNFFYVQGWRLSQKISPDLHLGSLDNRDIYDPPEDQHPISIASSRLLALEIGIERRYMKPPFRTVDSIPKPEGDAPPTTTVAKDETTPKVTPQLERWRRAVREAKSAAQLSMCITLLFESIAWEKSIMKVVSFFWYKEILWNFNHRWPYSLVLLFVVNGSVV